MYVIVSEDNEFRSIGTTIYSIEKVPFYNHHHQFINILA